MAIKEIGKFVNIIQWQSDNSWQREMQRIKKYKKTVESAHEQVAKANWRASAGMIKAEQAQARAREKVRKAAIAAQMRSQKQLQALETRMAREQARKDKMLSGVVSGRSMAKQRTITTMSSMRNMFSAATMEKYRASLQRLNAQYASGGMSLSMYNQKLQQLRNEMRATEASARRLGNAFKSALKSAGSKLSAGLSTFANTAFWGATAGTAGAVRLTNTAMQNSANRNSAYYGLMAQNEQDGKGNAKARTDDQMKFIKETAFNHGMDLATAEQGYFQFAASTKETISEADRRALFEAMAIKGRSVGADTQRMQRAQVAIMQSAGKGKFEMEELKGQLEEAFGGSISDVKKAYARSLGLEEMAMEDFNKAVKDGKVSLQKVLPYLVEIWNESANTEAYKKAMGQAEIAMTRLKSAAYNASIAMFGQIDATDGVYTLAELINDNAQALTDTLRENEGTIRDVGAGFAAFFDQLGYRAGQLWYWLKKVLDSFGVDTSDPAAIGKFVADAVTALLGLKALETLGIPAILTGIVSAFTAFKNKLLQLFPQLTTKTPTPTKTPGPKPKVPGPKPKIPPVRGVGLGPAAVGVAATELAKEAITGEGILNDTFGGFDYYQRLRSATTWGDFGKALIGKDADKAGWRVNENGEKVWHDERQGTSLWDNFTGMIKEWAQPAEMYRPSVTTNTSQAMPAPATGFNGATSSQVMVQSAGDINAQFELTVDENGLLRVVQKEVETQIGWEKVKEINMFAIGS